LADTSHGRDDERVLLQAHLEKVENEIVELSQNGVNLKSNFVELVELKHVLQRTQLFLTEVCSPHQNLVLSSQGVRCSNSGKKEALRLLPDVACRASSSFSSEEDRTPRGKSSRKAALEGSRRRA